MVKIFVLEYKVHNKRNGKAAKIYRLHWPLKGLVWNVIGKSNPYSNF